MRRTTAIAIATLVLLAAGAGLATNAHALNACTAADIYAQDGGAGRCPNNSGPCNIGKVFVIGNGCTVDFGTRAVTLLASGTIDLQSNAATIRAGSFTAVPGSRVEGRGVLSAPRDRGGLLTLVTTGAVDVQRVAPPGTAKAVFDFVGDNRGGTVNITAGGNITVNGDINTNGLTPTGGNGSITLRSTGGNVTTGANSSITGMGGILSSGGFIDIIAFGNVDLGTALVTTAGDGGVMDVAAGGTATVRGMTATGAGDAGSGGCASVLAGTSVLMLGPVTINGTGSPTQSGGGCGGFIDIDAGFGNATINASINADSGNPDGGGGGVGVVARGSITVAPNATISVQGIGGQSCGGEISLEADLDVVSDAILNASGGFGGNLIDLIAGRNVTVNAKLDAQGRDGGGFGGSVTVIAGDRGQGNASINALIDSSGGFCSAINGCGLGGFNEVSGCDVTIGTASSLLARGPDGGDNLLTAREQLRVQGTLDVTTTTGAPGVSGTNTIQFPSRLPAIITGTITPTPTSQARATCTAAGQTNCLVPCPTCGNGMVEFPETCDTSGTPVNCDGCSNFCRVQAQNCNDANGCTNDSCDLTLGCRNQPTNDGVSCTDNNICNGVEACQAGVCRPTTAPLNCNDLNVCTTDSCDPLNGCQHPPAPAGGLCNDNNACTLIDTCNGMGGCQPGAPRVCTDTNQCTTESCNPATGCVFPPVANNTPCEDGAYCSVTDTCQNGMCTAGPARDCSDTNSCTTDTCDEANDICVNNPSGSCCGDGTPNPGEQCDDGNASNEDGCLNTCVLATCGDGFIRTDVEQCDAGAQNSNAPNAACRLDCMPRRCGDGITDTPTEQCDDGGTTSGDGCSATCGAEPPATSRRIPGKGNTSTDCGLEWAYDNPVLDRRGIPSIKQSCVDGDPACDKGTTPGECTVHVWLCANNTDPQLPLCTPGAAGIGNIASVETRKPSTREAELKPVDAGNRQQLLLAADAAETTTPNFCGPRIAVRIPLRGTPAVNKGVKVLKLAGDTDKAVPVRDSDVLKVFCLPAP